MFSLIQKIFQRALSLDAVYDRIEKLEHRVKELDNISDERDSLWLIIDEMHQAEEAAFQTIQDELQEALIRSITPRGDA